MEQVLRMDLNTATEEELQSVPGIGEEMARAILEYREDFGGFIIVDQLLLVDGVSTSDVDAWRDYFYIGE
ncbi:MAG TPA: helix-hairpin-helix domain-containing protein [Candidatus Fournierella excrementavium]|nr:helix-hairpin-helix domain-containing protein [Candidatus Fournierella excrementavium]